MSGYADVVLKSYNDQVRNTFVPAGVTDGDAFDVLKKAVGNTNAAQLLYVEGGLFANCMLERPVMNVTITPKRALGNRIPVFVEIHKRACTDILQISLTRLVHCQVILVMTHKWSVT